MIPKLIDIQTELESRFDIHGRYVTYHNDFSDTDRTNLIFKLNERDLTISRVEMISGRNPAPQTIIMDYGEIWEDGWKHKYADTMDEVIAFVQSFDPPIKKPEQLRLW